MRIKGAFVMAMLLFASPLWADYKDALKMGDYETALREIKPLALKGDSEAQSILGTMYANGQGVPVNTKKAVEWTKKAAEKGYAKAQYNLGIMYDTGTGVTENYKEAAKWYRKAAEQNVVEAQFNLGEMYYQGQGVNKDKVKAYLWLSLAADARDERARKKKDILSGEMTSVQIKKGNDLVAKWRHDHQ